MYGNAVRYGSPCRFLRSATLPGADSLGRGTGMGCAPDAYRSRDSKQASCSLAKLQVIGNANAQAQIVLDVAGVVRQSRAHVVDFEGAQAKTFAEADVHASTDLHGKRIRTGDDRCSDGENAISTPTTIQVAVGLLTPTIATGDAERIVRQRDACAQAAGRLGMNSTETSHGVPARRDVDEAHGFVSLVLLGKFAV